MVEKVFLKAIAFPKNLVDEAFVPDKRSVVAIEKASGCSISISANGSLTIESTESQNACDIGAKYLEYSIGPKPVVVDPMNHFSDMLIQQIPTAHLSAIIARNGPFMCSLEEELGVVSFIADDKEARLINPRAAHVVNKEGLTTLLATDGDLFTRKGLTSGVASTVPLILLGTNARNLVAFKFKLMNMIEGKIKGTFTQFTNMDLTLTAQLHNTVQGYCIDTFPVAEEEISLATGRQGANRKRIASVSGCALEYIGSSAFVYGELETRQMARNFVTIFLERGRGSFTASKWKRAVGVTTIDIGFDQVGTVTGKAGQGIQLVEETANVICFLEGSKMSRVSSTENVRKPSTHVLLPPAMRLPTDSSDCVLSVKHSSSSDQRASILILGTDANAQLAVKMISERLGAKPAPAPRDNNISDIQSLFHKLFRSRGNKISVNSAPPPGNKLQTAIWDSMVTLMDGRKKKDWSESFSFSAPLADFTVMEVPSSFSVSGNNLLALLKQIDEEYAVMSGYVQHPSESSFVVIMGPLRPRRAAELKLMATIEAKEKGFYSRRIVRDTLRVCDQPWYVSTAEFDTDSFPIPERELSFALGQKGSIRKKLAVASGCILEYVGDVAYFSGTLSERNRGRDYLRWVLDQLKGEVLVPDYQKRIDIAHIPLRNRQAGYVNGNKGRLLRAAEELTGCFCFVARSLQPSDSTKPLLICGTDESKKAAFFALDKYLKEHQNSTWNDNGGNEDTNSTEALKIRLEGILKAGGIAILKPRDPWLVGSNESGAYVFVSQPCPGAARKGTELFPDSEKSEILLTSQNSSSGKKSASSSPRGPSKKTEFVNDSIAFPELGGKKKSAEPVKPPTEVPAPPPSPPPVTPPPQVPSTSRNAGIFIDRVNNQVWGDWGYGPSGDPEVAKSALLTSPESRLMGAWK